MQINETHENIIGILKDKGPSLPINLAKELEMSSLFISAFLSELTNQKRIKVSHLKIGGSPLYFVEGHEEKLEPYYKYLHPKEAETFLMLKKRKVLKDSDQEPSTRVALRSIRDFAVGFKRGEEIYWKYFLVEEREINHFFDPQIEEIKIENEETTQTGEEIDSNTKNASFVESKISKESVIENDKKDQKSTNKEFNNPLVIKEKSKKKKQKEKSEFVVSTIKFLNENNFGIVEEGDYRPKEYNCLVKVRSELGPIQFFTTAKDKKTITEGDVKKLLSDAQSIPLPALLLYTGEISKKAKDYLGSYSSIFKARKLE